MSGGSTAAEINVTPLIDVLLVLLIIFMVLVPVLPRGLSSSIPQKSNEAHTAAPEPPLVLALRATSPDPETPITYQLNGHTVPEANLRPELTRVFAARADRTLFVQADRSLEMQPVAAAVGLARAAGAGQVAFMHP